MFFLEFNLYALKLFRLNFFQVSYRCKNWWKNKDLLIIHPVDTIIPFILQMKRKSLTLNVLCDFQVNFCSTEATYDKTHMVRAFVYVNMYRHLCQYFSVRIFCKKKYFVKNYQAYRQYEAWFVIQMM